MDRPDVADDEILLSRMLESLKATGRLEYTGEYGPEITTFIPLVHWLKRQGLLVDRRVVTYRGMEPYYFFLDGGEFLAKDERRLKLAPRERSWPTNNTHTATRKPWHDPPDYRSFYAKRARSFEKPTLFIQNKFAVEWGIGPINFLPIRSLQGLLMLAVDKFQIVFSRPVVQRSAGYSNDHSEYCDYPDLDLVRHTNGVLILEDVARAEERPYNEVKLEFLAGAHLFVAVQGGSAHILAAFGNSLLAILHRYGKELPHAYSHGPYKYLSHTPPELYVARSDPEFRRAIEVILSAQFIDGRISSPLSESSDHQRLRM
jgi:hypothetical protein